MSQKGIAQVFTLVVLLFAVVLGVFLVRNYTSFLPKADVSGATLALVPNTVTHNLGCQFSMDINIDTAGHNTDGTDVILLYDPAAVTMISVTDGTLYPYYPGAVIDATTGKIKISGLASVIQPWAGSGRFATINAKLNEGFSGQSTQIRFSFDPANPRKTNDTNIVENGTIIDVLTQVTDATINIGSGTGCTVSSSPVPSADPSVSPTPSASPVAVPQISATIERAESNRYRAVVRWTDVANATAFDKIDMIFTPAQDPSKKSIRSSVYAGTCNTNIPQGTISKSTGSCIFNLSNAKGDYQFRYYNNSISSEVVTTPKR